MSLNDYKGCSLCVEPGQELYEYFYTGYGKYVNKLVQYDYRASSGELFSTVAPTLEDARNKKKVWINNKRS